MRTIDLLIMMSSRFEFVSMETALRPDASFEAYKGSGISDRRVRHCVPWYSASSGSQKAMSALGHKRTFAVRTGMSALPPIPTAKAKFRKKAMSALPPKGDIAERDRHFG